MPVKRTLVFGIALLLVLSAGVTAASRVNWTWSGAAVQNVALEDPDSIKMSLFEVQAKGSPGAANIIGLNRSFVPGGPAGDTEGCFEGADMKLVGGLSENSLVAVFKDGSILTMLKDPEDDGFGCLQFSTGHFYAEVPIYFNGGFGRFATATGKATIRLDAWPVGKVETGAGEKNSILLWEIGTITGHLDR